MNSTPQVTMILKGAISTHARSISWAEVCGDSMAAGRIGPGGLIECLHSASLLRLMDQYPTLEVPATARRGCHKMTPAQNPSL